MRPPAKAILRVQGLCKSYGGQRVVDHLNFELRAGECYGLLGPNGAGKTTTLRCCLGLTTADQGHIELLGQPLPQAARTARSKVGVVPQFDNLDPDFSVAENLLVFGRYFGLKDRETLDRLPKLLEFAGLGGKENLPLSSLSGGMKRRLTLARALVNDPDLLILDEPTTGLDPQARHLIWERLKQLLQQGKTILLTTHFMDEAERLSHRLAIMDHGRLKAEDNPVALIARHIEPHVVELYGEAAPQWVRQHVQALAARVEISGETAFCYLSDEQLQPLLAAAQQNPGLRILQRRANLEDVFLKLTGRELRD